jgi:hypothetical protein
LKTEDPKIIEVEKIQDMTQAKVLQEAQNCPKFFYYEPPTYKLTIERTPKSMEDIKEHLKKYPQLLCNSQGK